MVAAPARRKQNTLRKKLLKFEKAINTFFTEKKRIYTHTEEKSSTGTMHKKPIYKLLYKLLRTEYDFLL